MHERTIKVVMIRKWTGSDCTDAAGAAAICILYWGMLKTRLEQSKVAEYRS